MNKLDMARALVRYICSMDHLPSADDVLVRDYLKLSFDVLADYYQNMVIALGLQTL